MKALSIMQPWAWLITTGGKDIENRRWPTKVRGTVLIHAGKRLDERAIDDLRIGVNPITGVRWAVYDLVPATFKTGGIVGEAEIIDSVQESDSPWFVGPYGFVLMNARPLPFRPYRGQLGFFEIPSEEETPELQPLPYSSTGRP